MRIMKDWNQKEIGCAHSMGGVIAVAHPFDNLLRTGCAPWPPPEIAQKLHRSRQSRAFAGADEAACTSGLGHYCDLQSIHSEDAITWSVFGTAARAPQSSLKAWLAELMALLDLRDVRTDDPEVFLWRRLPHPDTLAAHGPEIDAGVSTANAIVLFEAKWRSPVGAAQGVMRDKDQIQLRGEFLQKHGDRAFPGRTVFAVVGISLHADAFNDTTPEGIAFRSTTWERVCSLAFHPHAEELRRYLEWKTRHTKMTGKASRATSEPASGD